MRNQNISDYVAATMDAVLKSQEHKSLFGTQYKYAEEVKKEEDKDSCMADDNDAKDKCHTCHKPMSKCECDSSKASDQNDAKHKKEEKDSSAADDSSKEDTSSANDTSLEEKISSAYDVAIDSFITASAALDSIGLGRGSAISIKLASLVLEAKKKEKESKKSKDSGKSSKDSNSAKDKKSKDTGKSSAKSSKDSNSAKDKKAISLLPPQKRRNLKNLLKNKGYHV